MPRDCYRCRSSDVHTRGSATMGRRRGRGSPWGRRRVAEGESTPPMACNGLMLLIHVRGAARRPEGAGERGGRRRGRGGRWGDCGRWGGGGRMDPLLRSRRCLTVTDLAVPFSSGAEESLEARPSWRCCSRGWGQMQIRPSRVLDPFPRRWSISRWLFTHAFVSGRKKPRADIRSQSPANTSRSARC
jgi:hypothetical protein